MGRLVILFLCALLLISCSSTQVVEYSAYEKARAYEDKGLYDKALETYEKALKKAYSDELYYNYLVVMAKSGSLEKACGYALEAYEKTSQKRYEDLAVEIYRFNDDVPNLIRALEGKEDKDESTRLELVSLYRQEGQFDKALEVLYDLYYSNMLSEEALRELMEMEKGQWEQLNLYLYGVDTTIADVLGETQNPDSPSSLL